jgi:UPF0716 protein FxsA
MIFLWFLAFLSWPVAEIWLFVEAGRAIGWLAALLITIATGAAGAVLMRIQGSAAMRRFLENADRGELPVETVVDGMGIFAAGLLLLLPGFLSDMLGLLLFIPPLRRRLTRWLFRRVLEARPFPRQAPPRQRPEGPRERPSPRGFRRSDDVVDAEFETIEPTPAEDEAEPRGRPGNSPWRRS